VKDDVFFASPVEVQHIMDKLEFLGDDPTPDIPASHTIRDEDDVEPELPIVPPPTTATLQVVHRGHGKYNVINTETGKPVNDIESPLTKLQAEELAASYGD
jgi:hypothetical protein